MFSIINLKENARIFLITICSSFVGILLYYVTPYFTGYLIDNIVMKEQLAHLKVWLALAVIFSVFLHAYLFYFLKYIWSKYGIILSNKIRNNLARKILNVPTYKYEAYNNSLLYNLIMNDSYLVGSITLTYIASSILSILRIVTCFVILWLINYKLTLLSMIFVPLYAGAMFLNRKRLEEANNQERLAMDSLVFTTNKLIEGKTSINLFHQEGYFKNKFDQVLKNWTSRKLRYLLVLCLTKELPNFLSTLAPFIVLAYGSVLVSQGEFTIGMLVMYSQYITMIFEPLNILASTVVEKKSSAPVFKRVQNFLDEEDQVPVHNFTDLQDQLLVMKDHHILNKDGGLLFTVEDLEIDKAGIYIIRGDNGVGKSTLLNLLASINKPSSLEPINSNSVLHIDQNLDKKFSYLYQPGFIFEGTIEENITFGESNPHLLNEIVSNLGIDWLDKSITFNPLNLSLGEQQKLHLARTFYQNQAIVLLDEPLANLDQETKAKLKDYILSVKNTKVFLIISHDSDLIEIADSVINIQDQKLSQVRKRLDHSELMQSV